MFAMSIALAGLAGAEDATPGGTVTDASEPSRGIAAKGLRRARQTLGSSFFVQGDPATGA
jgi:hypothetical protein